jgi:DNA-binding CsgD family transcriptional regulator
VNAAAVPSSTRAEASDFINAAPGTPGRRALIVGEPGIGKSTLIEAAAARFGAAGVRVLRASPSFAERHTAFSMLWDLLGDLDWNTFTHPADEYRTILDIALGRTPAASELPTLATAVALGSILAELSAQTPVVLLIDDLHWSDPESLATVERAFRRLGASRVSLVATSREYGTRTSNAPDFEFDPADVHTLEGLTVDELEILTRPAWPSTLTRAQVVTLREHTGGNPMWALALIERGVIGELGALRVGTVHAPPPLAVAVADRLRALSGDAADVVSVVALLGRPDLALLSEVLRFSATPPAAVNEAEAAGFLVLSTRSARIQHPLYASAATARLAPARRRELHRFIARAISDPVVRAQHLQQSQPPGPDEEIAQALASAAVAMRLRGARLRSAHFDAQAVERTDPQGEHLQDRLINQAQQLFSAGDHAACLRALDRVTADHLDGIQYDTYLALSTSALSWGAHPAAAEDFLAGQGLTYPADSLPGRLDGTLDDTQPAPPLHSARSAMLRASAVSFGTITVSERARLAASALDELPDVDTPNAVHRSLRGLVRARVDAGSGLDHSVIADMDRRQSIQIVVGLDDTGLAVTGFSAHLVDDVETSRASFDSLVTWARAEGKEGVERTFLAHAAQVEIIGGDLPTAQSFARRSGYSALSAALPTELQPAFGLLLIAAGRYTELTQMVTAWRVSAAGGRHRELELEALLGFSALAQRDWHTAIEHLRVAALTADSLELVELGSRFRLDLPLIEALLQGAEIEEAGERLEKVQRFLADHTRPISQIAFHRVKSLHLAAKGDLHGALAEANTSVSMSAALARAGDEGRALLQRARVLQRMRRVTRARSDLDAARALADVVGISDLSDQVDSALSTARRTRSTTELTTAELGVLACVRRGRSNKEIAAELFISVRTVESHVAAILRKTGTAGRSKLISGE